jgi:hypothetical protein
MSCLTVSTSRGGVISIQEIVFSRKSRRIAGTVDWGPALDRMSLYLAPQLLIALAGGWLVGMFKIRVTVERR